MIRHPSAHPTTPSLCALVAVAGFWFSLAAPEPAWAARIGPVAGVSLEELQRHTRLEQRWSSTLARLERLGRRDLELAALPGDVALAPAAAGDAARLVAAEVREGLRWLRAAERGAAERRGAATTRSSSPELLAAAERLSAMARLRLDSDPARAAGRDSLPGPRAATVRGRVRDRFGEPVRDAEVAVYRHGDSGIEFGALTFTDADGRFVLGGLDPGSVELEVRSARIVDLALGQPLCRALAVGRGSCHEAGPSVDLRAGQTVELDLRGISGVAVTGTITDEVGAPITDAYVAVRDAVDRQVGAAFADANGVYRIENLLDETLFVVAQAQGKNFEIYDDLPCPGWDCHVQNVGQAIDPEPGVDVVADFDLGPGGHIRVSVLDAGTAEFLPAWPATSVSFFYADGSFACRGSQIYEPGPEFLSCALPDGDYLVVAASPAAGYVSRVYDGVDCVQGCPFEDGTRITVVQGQVADITMSLHKGGSISGSVTDAATGEPLPEPPSLWLYDTDGNYLQSVGVPADGHFQIVGLQSGSYHLYTLNYTGYFDELWQGIPYRHSTGDPTIGQPIAVTFGEDTGGIDFTLDKGLAIRGTLTERNTGAPLSYATVSVYDADRFSRNATVGIDGTWVMQPLHPGTYRVRTSHRDPDLLEHMWQGIDCPLYACDLDQATPIELGARGDADGIDLTVIAGARIRGTVRDEEGEPIVGARVWAGNRSGSRGGAVGSSDGITGADGSYEIGSLGAGEHTVIAQHPDHVRRALGGSGYCSEWECGLESGAPVVLGPSAVVSGIDFVLPHGGVVEGRITARIGGHGLGSAGFWLYDAEGMPVEGGFSEPDGTFRLQAVPKDGDYTLSVVFAPLGYIRATWRNLPSTFFPGAAPATQTLAGDRITFPATARGDIATATAELALDTTGDATSFRLENEFLDPAATGTSAATGVYTCTIQSCGYGSNPVGTVLQLEATPGPGSVFVGWSGDPQCATGVVTLDDDVTCTATFDVDPDAPAELIFEDGFESGSTTAWG